MSLDLGALKPGARLPWKGKVWTVEKWASKAHPGGEGKLSPDAGFPLCRWDAWKEPILCLRAEDGKRLRLGLCSKAWEQFCRDMESVRMVTQPHCRGENKCSLCLAGIWSTDRGLDITALPWMED